MTDEEVIALLTEEERTIRARGHGAGEMARFLRTIATERKRADEAEKFAQTYHDALHSAEGFSKQCASLKAELARAESALEMWRAGSVETSLYERVKRKADVEMALADQLYGWVVEFAKYSGDSDELDAVIETYNKVRGKT